MATSFYSRTLPAPRVVSVSGGTWLSLGFPDALPAQIPAEYVDGGGVGYLVQFQLQRTSSNATIRLNLDTNPSGSGGAALPEFINLFETGGLFRLTAGSVSRVFDIADATTGDTEEPYVWSWASTAFASEMRAVVDALRVDEPPSLELELLVPDGTLTVRATLGRPVGARIRVGKPGRVGFVTIAEEQSLGEPSFSQPYRAVWVFDATNDDFDFNIHSLQVDSGGLVLLQSHQGGPDVLRYRATVDSHNGRITYVDDRPLAKDALQQTLRVGTAETRAWVGSYFDDEGNHVLPLRYKLEGGVFHPSLSVEASVGRPKATVIGQAEGIAAEASVGRPRGYIPKVRAQGLAAEATVGQPAGFRHQFAYIEYLHLEPLGVRSRTRTGGAVWEWSNLDLTIPYPVGDSNPITTVRLRSDQLRVTDDSNALAGLGADFIRHGDLLLYSPAAGEFHIDPMVGRFNSEGRLILSGDEWDAWWATFSADPASELTIEWFFHGLEPQFTVGRPEGVKEAPKADALGIRVEATVGRPVAMAHALGITAEASLGRPRGYVPKVRAQGLSVEATTGRPVGVRRRVGEAQGIAVAATTARPRGYVPNVRARGLSVEATVGMPAGLRARVAHALGITAEASLGRPRGYVPNVRATGLAVEATVGRPTGQRLRVADAQGITAEATLARPRGYLPSVAAQGLTAEATVGTARAVLFGRAQGASERTALGAATSLQSRGTRATWSMTGLSLAAPIGDGTTITSVRLRSNQLRISGAGNTLAGVGALWQAHGTLLLSSPNAGEVRVTPNFDSAGRMNPRSDPGWDAWWAAFSADLANEPLTLVWLFDSLHGAATLGRPVGSTIMPASANAITAEATLGRPRGYLPKVRANGITAEATVGRARGYLAKVRAQGLSVVATVGKAVRTLFGVPITGGGGGPVTLVATTTAESQSQWTPPDDPVDGYNFDTFNALGNGYSFTGLEAPDGQTFPTMLVLSNATLGSKTLNLQLFGSIGFNSGLPDGWRQFVIDLQNLPIADRALSFELTGTMGEAAAPFGAVATLGRPRGYLPKVRAQGVTVEAEVGQARAVLFGKAQGLTFEATLGRPMGEQKRIGNARGLTAEATLGRPRGYLPKVRAEGIAVEATVGRPRSRASAVAQGIRVEATLGRPVGVRDRMADARGFTVEATLGRPRGYLPKVRALGLSVAATLGRPARTVIAFAQGFTVEATVGRARGILASVAARGLSVAATLGMPEGIRKRIARAQGLSVEATLAQPRGYVPKVRAQGLAVEATVGQPMGLRIRSASARGIRVEATVGRPVGRLGSIPAQGIGIEATVGRPRGYLPKVRAVGIAAEASVGRAVGTRRREASAIGLEVEATLGQPHGLVQAVAVGVVVHATFGRPVRYWPRRRGASTVEATPARVAARDSRVRIQR